MSLDSRSTIWVGNPAVEVGVEIVSPVTAEIAGTIDQEWLPLLKAAATEDADWVWSDIVGEECSGPGFASFAMINVARVEGVLVLERGRRMRGTLAEGVTMHYLATAPWNRQKDDGSPLVPGGTRARPVGAVLLARAIMFSQDEGYEGRLGWESLDGAIKWYKDQFEGLPPLAEFGRDLGDEKLFSFETDSKAAQAFLERFQNHGPALLRRCR